MKDPLIELTLKALRKHLADNDNIIDIYCGEGVYLKTKCLFNEPASDEKIALFEKKQDVIIPDDYRNFLKQCNGCTLFDDIKYGGESYLLSLKEIEEYHNIYVDMPKGWIIVGYFYEDLIIIDTNKYSKGNLNYLLVNDCCSSYEYAKPLNSNFEIWFDRVIINQGSKFWTWKIYNADNYYKLCR